MSTEHKTKEHTKRGEIKACHGTRGTGHRQVGWAPGPFPEAHSAPEMSWSVPTSASGAAAQETKDPGFLGKPVQ